MKKVFLSVLVFACSTANIKRSNESSSNISYSRLSNYDNKLYNKTISNFLEVIPHQVNNKDLTTNRGFSFDKRKSTIKNPTFGKLNNKIFINKEIPKIKKIETPKLLINDFHTKGLSTPKDEKQKTKKDIENPTDGDSKETKNINNTLKIKPIKNISDITENPNFNKTTAGNIKSNKFKKTSIFNLKKSKKKSSLDKLTKNKKYLNNIKNIFLPNIKEKYTKLKNEGNVTNKGNLISKFINNIKKRFESNDRKKDPLYSTYVKLYNERIIEQIKKNYGNKYDYKIIKDNLNLKKVIVYNKNNSVFKKIRLKGNLNLQYDIISSEKKIKKINKHIEDLKNSKEQQNKDLLKTLKKTKKRRIYQITKESDKK